MSDGYKLMRRCQKCGAEYEAEWEKPRPTIQILTANAVHEDCGGRTILYRVDEE